MGHVIGGVLWVGRVGKQVKLGSGKKCFDFGNRSAKLTMESWVVMDY